MLREHAFQHHLQLGQLGGCVLAPGDGAPGLEPLLARAQRANAGLHAVGNHQGRVAGKERRDLRLIGLQLLMGTPDRGVLVGRVLQFDHRQGQAVHEQHHVWPAGVLALGHGKLIDRQPVVVAGLGEIDHLRLPARDGTIFSSVLHGHAIHQHPMHRVVALDERRRVAAGQLAEGIFQRLGGQIGVEAYKGLAQAAFQHHVAVVRVAALCGRHAYSKVRAVQHGVVQCRQPGKRGLFDDGFGEGGHARGSARRFMMSRTISSLATGALSAMSKASAVKAGGLSRRPIPSCCR